MRKNHLYLLMPILHLILALNLNAQDTLNTSSYFEAPLIGRRYLPPPNGDGSPFLFNGIVNGDIVVTTGDTVKNKLLRLDGLRNELVWMNDQFGYIGLDSSQIKAFTLYPKKDSPHHFTKMAIKLPSRTDSSYCYIEILNDTVFLTYAYRYIEVIKEQQVIDGALRETNLFKPVATYFIKLQGFPIKQIALRRGSLLKAFPSYSKNMKKILNKSKIRAIKNEQQLKEAVLLLARSINLADTMDK